MRKNKMHACMRLAVFMLTIAVVSPGGMHDVYAKGTSQSTPKAKIEIVSTSSNKSTSASAKTVGSAKITPTIEVIVDTSVGDSVGGIEYSKLVMANVEEAVNIREEASEQSSIVGKLYKECGGEILKKENGWTKIKSGNVTGWVNNKYLLFGSEAKKLADSVVNRTATSTTDCLRVRKSPSESAEVYGLLAKGDKISVIEQDGDWTKVEYSDGTICYVASRYITVSDELGYGESMEEISAKEEAAKKEAAKEEAAADNAASSGSKASSSAAVPVTNNGAISGDVNDVRLLAALIQCEAGRELYDGQVAVGAVVMNRLRTGRYGNSIMSVIYAKGQFGPASSGQVAQVYAIGPSASCMSAASEAMAGTSNVGLATHFRNIKSGYPGIVIGNHVFW